MLLLLLLDDFSSPSAPGFLVRPEPFTLLSSLSPSLSSLLLCLEDLPEVFFLSTSGVDPLERSFSGAGSAICDFDEDASGFMSVLWSGAASDL